MSTEVMTEKERIDVLYQRIKNYDPQIYRDICAFSSIIIEGCGAQDFKKRAQIEKFCMSLVDRVIP